MIHKLFGKVIPDQNQLIYQLIKTRYAKRAINSFIVLLLSFFIRVILYAILSFIILFDNLYIDFFTQCGISIALLMVNNYIQNFTEHFSDDLYKITRHLINNYSEENFRKWKNYVVGTLLSASFLYFYLVDINSQVIRIYILQYTFCFFFFDIKDNKYNIIRNKLIGEEKNKENKIYLAGRNVENSDFIIIEKKMLSENAPIEINDETNNDNKKKLKYEIKNNFNDFDIIEHIN